MIDRRLEYFVAVAEELNFTRAAARLHISPSPLTQQIRRLEQEFGHQLFIRTTRRVELTAAGAALLVEARLILRHSSRLPAIVDAAAEASGRHLRIGVVPSAMFRMLPSLVRRFTASHPETPISVRQMSVEEQLRAFDNSEIDVGLHRSYTPLRDHATFDLPPEDYCAVLPRSHALAAQRKVSWRSLAGERLLVCQRDVAPLEFDSIVRACAVNGFTPTIVPTQVFGYNQAALVAAGLGVAAVPELATGFELENVTYRYLSPSVEAVPMRIVVRTDRFDDATRELIEIARSIPVMGSPQLTVSPQ